MKALTFWVSLAIILAAPRVLLGQTIASDDFNQFNINRNVWTITDPLGDGTFTLTGTNTTNARVSIAVPGGVAHDLYTTGNNAPRITQAAPNANFSITVKFESAVTSAYQIQGFLAEQSATNFLRFDYYSDGGSTRLFAGNVDGNTFTQYLDFAVGSSNIQPLYMRIERSGNTWKVVPSLDGSTWLDSASFTHTLTLTRVGVYGGNAESGGVVPAHTVLVDFFQNNATPIASEDGNSSVSDTLKPYLYNIRTTTTSSSIQFLWKTDEPANGRVEYGTTSAYELGFLSHPTFITSHTLQANGLSPATLYHYRIISADAGGRADTTADRTVSTSDSYGLTDVRVYPTSASVTFTWTTSVPTTGRVAYGTTTAYGDTLVDTTLSMTHLVNFTGLNTSTLYHFRIITRDSSGTMVSTGDSTFTTITPSTLVTDEFNTGTLGAHWLFQNPSGDGTQGVTGTHLTIGVPSGSRHDVWTDLNNAPRVRQLSNNADFAITVKFDSGMTQRYQIQGLLLQEDSLNFVRLDLNSDGVLTNMFAASFSNNVPTIRLNQAVEANGVQPLYMRVTRAGARFKVEHSTDGGTWTEDVVFYHPITISSVALFTGNVDNNPAFTSYVDYFRVTGGAPSVTANLRAILEGAYSVVGDSMRTDLASVMPLSQPYNTAPWNYTGTETVASIPAGVVDWVLLELRTSTSSASRVAMKAAFIKKDGSIVHTSGSGAVTFVNITAGNYYVVVHHRNHLSVMSASAIALSSSSSLYDFTTASAQAFGTNPMKQVNTNIWAMVAGDANRSGIITAADANNVFNALNSTVYDFSDINLSGIVTAADANATFSNINRSSQVP